MKILLPKNHSEISRQEIDLTEFDIVLDNGLIFNLNEVMRRIVIKTDEIPLPKTKDEIIAACKVLGRKERL
jgi:hypothetical protein